MNKLLVNGPFMNQIVSSVQPVLVNPANLQIGGRLPFRQVHLDFHTSEHIRDIGADFDEKLFQQALKDSRVDSITLFAKCHHSWSYYPTQVGQPHPHLRTNLLGRQIAACHQIGVRCPIYITVGWSSNDAANHPEWCVRRADGQIMTHDLQLDAPGDMPRPPVSWVHLWPGGEYGELIVEQTREICRMFKVDGLFYDICGVSPSYDPITMRQMVAAGVDVANPTAVRRHALGVWARFAQRCRDVLFEYHPQATVFFNGNSSWDTPDVMLRCHTHFELEHMPSVWGGYDNFPLRVRALQRYGKPFVAMSGKFHTMWGEFGGYKHPQAMKLEVAGMAAHGCRASFGDQLHPTGKMDPATYRHLAVAYEYAEALEPYLDQAVPVSDLGILRSSQHNDAWQSDQDPSDPDSFGVAQMLLESHREFTVVTPDDTWDGLRTLVLPGRRFLDDATAACVQQFIERGGNVLIFGQSVLDVREDRMAMDVGARWDGHPQYRQDYLAAGPALRARNPTLVETPLLCYDAGERITVTDGQPLAAIYEPYFDRTYAQYCSHMNSPPKPTPSPYTAAVKKGRVIYLAHPLGRMYHQWGARLHRELFITALSWLDPTPIVETQLPSMARISLLHQPAAQRYLLHVIYAPPAQRGRACVLEDHPELLNIPLKVRLPHRIIAARLEVEHRSLDLTHEHDGIRLTLPQVNGHAFVVLEYEQPADSILIHH